MTMIFYSGRTLDDPSAIDPIVLRGYDAAGNLLTAIRYGAIPSREYVDPEFSYQTRYETSGLFDRLGNPVSPIVTINERPRVYPQVMASDSAGHLYAASSTITVRPYGSAALYADWFRKYRRNGDRIPFPQLHGGAIEALALAADGALYVGGAAVGASGYFLRKYDSSGGLLWSVAADSEPLAYNTVLDIGLDGAGNVYTLSEYTSLSGTGNTSRIARYNPSNGALVWRRWLNCHAHKNKMVLYNGGLYLSGAESYYFTGDRVAIPSSIVSADTAEVVAYQRVSGVPKRQWVAKFDLANGNYLGGIGEVTEDSRIRGAYYLSRCPVNNQFFLSVVKNIDSWSPEVYSLLVYSNTLAFVNELALDHDVPQGIRFDGLGNRYFIEKRRTVYLGGNAYGSTFGFYHFPVFSVSGTQKWGGVNATGKTGVWHTGGAWPDSGYQSWTINGVPGSGTYLAMHNAYGNIPDYANLSLDGAATNPWPITDVAIIEQTQKPSLPFKISFGVPSVVGDRYSAPPGLAFPVTFGLPVWVRDYVAQYAITTVCRLIVDATLLLAVSWIQCRRHRTGDTQITVVCPGVPPATVDALLGAVGRPMVIYRGPQGVAQLDVLFGATLKTVRYDGGAQSASVTLSGTAAAEITPVKTRILRGISYQQQAGTGRRVRGDVDTWLRPGDFLDIGEAEPLAVTEIVYQISPESAFMEIS